jgi:Sulfotransferase family
MSAVARMKERAPRPALDAANTATRAFGLATARWRALPDFFIVGTKRGGTTSLWNWLDGHPQVLSMFPKPRGLKSTDFFFTASRGEPRWYRSHFHTTTYRALAGGRRGPVVNGEASPYYMYGPHVPRLMSEVVPDARILVLLRDPVERAYSHYQERKQQGVETLSFADALAAEEERTSEQWRQVLDDPERYSSAVDFFSYRDRGVYLPQLERLYAAYPLEQVLVLRSEDLYAEPQKVFDAACDFLAISRHPLGHPKRHNEIKRAPMDPALREELTEFYRPHNEALYSYLGRDLGWD